MSDPIYQDYDIDEKALQSTVKIASWWSLVLLSFFSFGATVVIFFLYLDALRFEQSLLNQIIIAISITVTIALMGALGGLTWQRIGLWIASNTYKVYRNMFKNAVYRSLGSVYMFFVGDQKEIYLEAKALDPNYRNPIFRLVFVFRVGITQLSFFMVYLTLLWGPIFRNYIDNWITSGIYTDFKQEFQILLSLMTSVGTLAFYLPATYIIRDANVRTWDMKKRVIDQPLSTVRRRIDSFVGLGAVISGWEFYQGFLIDDFVILSTFFPGLQANFFFSLTDYFLLLIAIIIVTAPIVYPASVVYTFRHQKNVNTYRAKAILAGVPVGIAKIRAPEDPEPANISNYVSTTLA